MSDGQKFLLAESEEILITEDIADPDKHIDKFIEGVENDELARKKYETIKLLDHEEKVKWLLSLSDSCALKSNSGAAELKTSPVTICTIVVVTTVVMVVVGTIIVNGVTKVIKERQERQREVEKCITKPGKP